ncbi:MAG: hypothetical protein V4447_10665 [Pseudomonadota bacterium]
MSNSNPMIPQGTLNRLRGSVNFVSNPQLNVTAPYLGKAGISITLEGESTAFIPAMTGAVTSAEPFMMASVEVNLLKTQGLASVYKARMESNSLIGDIVVTPDASTLTTFGITNCAIESVKPLQLNGEDAGFVATIKGTYFINNDAWNLV